MPGKQGSDSRSPMTEDNIPIRRDLNTQFEFYVKFTPEYGTNGNNGLTIAERGNHTFTVCGRKLIRSGMPPSNVKANQKIRL